jgi:hypothetical protein
MHKIGTTVLFIWAVCCFTSLQAQYQTVPVTGFNADVVADVAGNANGSTNAAYDASNYVFMSPTYNPSPGTSLPATGLINTAITTTPGLQFQLAPYTGNNDLRLTTNQNGALTFVTATQTKELYVLGSTGQGFSNANITVTFTDNTTQAFSNVNFQDWFNGSDFAIKGMGRCLRTTNVITNDTSNPRIYQVKLDLLPANYYKFVQSISFTNTVTTSAVLNIMAITIKPPPVLYPYDPMVSFISKPLGSCFSQNVTLSVRIKNMGSNPINLAINPVTVNLSVNGPSGLVTHSIVVSTGNLSAMGIDSLPVIFNGANSFNLFAGGNYYINTTLSISGLVNGSLANDSISPGHTLINYRPTPGPDYHVCQNNLIPFGQGLTVQGCSTPLLDSATITFSIGSGCTDNFGSTGTGGSVGAPANCDNQYSCLFATGVLPALPTGAFFTTPGSFSITNLALNPSVSTFYANANQVRFNLYGAAPISPTLYSPGDQGANGTLPFNYNRNINASELAAIYSSLQPGSILNVGYWESWNDNQTLSDIIANSGGNSVATLKFYYYYYLPSFEWYQTPSGGSSIYALSPLNPFNTANTVVNNSNTVGTFTFYVACSGTSTCRSPVNLVIDSTPVSMPAVMASCEMITGSNVSVFDLTTVSNQVANNNLLYPVSYYNDPGLFTALPYPAADTTGSTTVYAKVLNTANGCYSSSPVALTVNSNPDIQPEPMFGLTCNCLDVVSLINPFSFVPAGSDTLYYEDASCTALHPNPHVVCTSDTVYVVVKTSSNPSCADTATAFIDLSAGSAMIANQDPGNFTICNSIPAVNAVVTDGIQTLFYNPFDCKKIATIQDVPNGISLGTTTVEEEIACSVPVHINQPYLTRAYRVIPGTQDTATVCLYYLQDDINVYNFTAQALGWPQIDTNSLAGMSITKVDNGDLNTPGHTASIIPEQLLTKTYDPVTTIWTVCFPVNSFSYFYAHATNLYNTPLPSTLTLFEAEKKETNVNLRWTTAQEKNMNYFTVERSRNGKDFDILTEPIYSRSVNGYSDLPLDYQAMDANPLSGVNYYRLQMVDLDGTTWYSHTQSVYFGTSASFAMYPNPVRDRLFVRYTHHEKSKALVMVYDAVGRMVQQEEFVFEPSKEYALTVDDLRSGTYSIRIQLGKGMVWNSLFVKE